MVSSIWTRQGCDTDESWPVFKEYRDQATPRRLRPGSAGLEAVRKWYVDHDWRGRVVAYDVWVDSIQLEERESYLRLEAKTVTAALRATAKDMRDVADRELQKLLQISATSDTPITHRVNDIVKLVDAATKLSLLVQGEATDRVEFKTDLSSLTPAELMAYRQLVLKTQKP